MLYIFKYIYIDVQLLLDVIVQLTKLYVIYLYWLMIEVHGKSRLIYELSTLWDAVSCCAFVTAVCRRVSASFANSSSPFSTAISARRYQSSAILSVCSLELKAATSSETTEEEAAKWQMHQHMFFLNKYYIWYLSIQWLGQDLNMFNHVQSHHSKQFNRSPSPSGSGVSSVLQGPWSIAASAMTATSKPLPSCCFSSSTSPLLVKMS